MRRMATTFAFALAIASISAGMDGNTNTQKLQTVSPLNKSLSGDGNNKLRDNTCKLHTKEDNNVI